MDSHYAVDIGSIVTEDSLIASTKKLKNEQSRKSKLTFTENTNSKNIVNEGLVAGQKIAKISIIILLSIGISELLINWLLGWKYSCKSSWYRFFLLRHDIFYSFTWIANGS